MSCCLSTMAGWTNFKVRPASNRLGWKSEERAGKAEHASAFDRPVRSHSPSCDEVERQRLIGWRESLPSGDSQPVSACRLPPYLHDASTHMEGPAPTANSRGQLGLGGSALGYYSCHHINGQQWSQWLSDGLSSSPSSICRPPTS
mmetsp:Transcript_5162/g.7240  ORF Transcript_5162/g.7240 Transcript_5162/m.7240 type:complete len:145 (+) Transcript_5162:648-1082(+)